MKTYLFSKTGILLVMLLVIGTVIAPVTAGEVTKQLSVPYYEQETTYYCGPAVAQMWIDYHNGYISQDTLWDCILSHNLEGWPPWYTDPYGLAACVSDYLTNFVAEDRRWSYSSTANIAMAMDILVSGEPVPRDDNTTRPAVWSDTLVRPTPTAGVDRETYYDQMTEYYEAVAKNVTLMADEEDNIPLTEDTNLAAFARQMMIEIFGYKEELEGAIPGESVFVHSLDENRHDYYLIPFERDGYITVVAQVSIKGDVADYSGAFTPAPKTQNVVRPTLEEARAVLAESGYDSTLPARLVWKPCEQTPSSAVPVWEFTKDDGDTVYVGYVPWKKQVEFYEELTRKAKGG